MAIQYSQSPGPIIIPLLKNLPHPSSLTTDPLMKLCNFTGRINAWTFAFRLLTNPICSITIQSYTDIQKQGEVNITAGLKKRIRDKEILLVDDIADSGKTLKRAIGYL